jgi:hypothetical protein
MLNPNSAHAWMARGFVSYCQNRPSPAIEAFERAMRLSPLDPQIHLFTCGLAFAHIAAGRYEFHPARRCLERFSTSTALSISSSDIMHDPGRRHMVNQTREWPVSV